jgi:aminopeptidase N
LFAADGQLLPLRLAGEDGAAGTERVLEMIGTEQRHVFAGIEQPPVPSLLRGFSAPVILQCEYSAAQLALLLSHDVDGFNRWEAGQQLAVRGYENLRDDSGSEALDAWCQALAALFERRNVADALLADLLTPPGEVELAERETTVDPQRIRVLRQQLQQSLARRLGRDALMQRHAALAAQANDRLDAASQAQRRLKRRLLELLETLEPDTAAQLAAVQFQQAPGMTDRLGALTVLVRSGGAEGTAALQAFRARHAADALAMDKWFAVQAQLPGEPALQRVLALEADAAFTLKNPNRVHALIGSYVRGNPSGFHRADGGGYRFLAERLLQLDALNPQLAARLATAFNGWQRLEPQRREAARAAMATLAQRDDLSRNLAEIIENMLHHPGLHH